MFFGLIKKIYHKDEKTGFTILKVALKEPFEFLNEKVYSLGVLTNASSLIVGTPIKFSGSIQKSEYGPQVETDFVEFYSDLDQVEITTFLRSLKLTESQIKKVILTNKDIFAISADKENTKDKLLKDALEKISIFNEKQKVYNFLLPYGVNLSLLEAFVEEYGNLSYEMITKNPYKNLIKLKMSMSSIDKIGQKLRFPVLFDDRIKGFVEESMDISSSYGHTYVNKMDAVSNVKAKCSESYEVPNILINKYFEESYRIGKDETKSQFFIKKIRRWENEVARNIKRLNLSPKSLNYTKDIYKKVEKEIGISFGKEQREAFKLIEKTGIGILLGGPGTGKTTTINGIIRAYELLNPNNKVVLAAPTGRAAQRMAEVTKRPASTIHRLLNYMPYEKEKDRVYEDIDADLIVVDETSMLNVEIASVLFSAIKKDSLLILIGDTAQLPAVGAGDVLGDMINSKTIRCFELTEVRRQKDESTIITNANKIRYGNVKLDIATDFRSSSFKNYKEILENLVIEALDKYDAADIFKFQVLTPVHRGMLGTKNLNRILQKALNKRAGGINYGKKTFKIGDKIIMLQNNYEQGYFNGDIGVVENILSSNKMIINISGEKLTIERELFEDVDLGYAITVHKSQGSEFENVAFIIPENPKSMLKRNLTYTAITRAKSTVSVLFERNSLVNSIKKEEEGTRNTNLKDILQNCS